MDEEHQEMLNELIEAKNLIKADEYGIQSSTNVAIEKIGGVIASILGIMSRNTPTAIVVAFGLCGFFHDCSALLAKPPQTFTGVVTRISDGDTYIVKRDGDGTEVKVRLHYADCPEVAHNKNEVDQPDGQAALKAATKIALNSHATVTVRGESYGRIVGDVVCCKGDTCVPLAVELLSEGHAMLDPRFKPPANLVEIQGDAKKHHLGLWADADPTPPWEWREQVREKAIASRSK